MMNMRLSLAFMKFDRLDFKIQKVADVNVKIGMEFFSFEAPEKRCIVIGQDNRLEMLLAGNSRSASGMRRPKKPLHDLDYKKWLEWQRGWA